ncbi:MAG: arsenite methyltransferase [Planctomycetota bacterium]|jgi:SAM-dependent methyltransferase
MQNVKDDQIREAVRKTYGQAAKADNPGSNCGCGGGAALEDVSMAMGYSPEDVWSAPEGSNMGLGCGNPQAIASLQPGQKVLDLGSGGGFDCFLAAEAVGPAGQVIGVDMTPEMISKARENAGGSAIENVEFRLGEIEHLPVADSTVDVVMSNCVINLSPQKPNVLAEAFRVLRPGGRLAVTDVVATAPLPEKVRSDLELHVGCVAGAAQVSELEAMLKEAGFAEIRIRPINGSKELIRKWAEETEIADYIVSATIEAVKP